MIRGCAGQGAASHGSSWHASTVRHRSDGEFSAGFGAARYVVLGLGRLWQSTVRYGSARVVSADTGTADKFLAMSWPGAAGPGRARRGKSRVVHGQGYSGDFPPGDVRLGRACLGKARQLSGNRRQVQVASFSAPQGEIGLRVGVVGRDRVRLESGVRT